MDRMREEVNMVFKMMQIQALLVSCQFDSISVGPAVNEEVKGEDDTESVEGSGNTDNVNLEIIVKLEQEENTSDCNMIEAGTESFGDCKTDDEMSPKFGLVICQRKKSKKCEVKIISNKCSQCGQHFTSKFVLDRHINSIHKNSQFPCNLCSKKFKRRDKLSVHIQVEHEMKFFNCHLCDQ
jgi:hypothetical protein